MPTTSDPSGFLDRRYAATLEEIVRDLHDLADRVASEGQPSDRARENPHAQAASRVISRVMNALPNLGLGLLTEAAATIDAFAAADVAVAKAEAEVTATRDPKAPPSTHPLAGSNAWRQGIGEPGHCEECARVGHVAAHPKLGCADVGCTANHDQSRR